MAAAGSTGRRRPGPLNSRERSVDDAEQEAQKRAAARAAADLVEDGMRVGLGTGTTVAHLLPALAGRELSGLRCVATSPETALAARALGLPLEELDAVGELDIAIDGADQVDPGCWLVKGGGGAHTREKIVAAAAERFVVIVSGDKDVTALAPPVPLELVPFGVGATLRALAPAALRHVPPSPDGGLIADYTGAIEAPRVLAERLSSTPGVVEHGLFPPEMVSLVILATREGIELRRPG
jgi:ribose 5-phosphate isomerase A